MGMRDDALKFIASSHILQKMDKQKVIWVESYMGVRLRWQLGKMIWFIL